MQKPARFLVTGLNGVTGWNLYQRIAREYACLGTYRKNHRVFQGTAFTQLDFSDLENLRACVRQWQPDYVVHAWAMCDLDLCETFPEMAHKVNVEGTQHLLEALAGAASLKKVVFISTDHVFNGDTGGYVETDVPIPKHVFGRTRRAAELCVLESGLPALVIRPGLVIGKSFQGNKGPRDFLLTRLRAQKKTHYFTDEWRSPIQAEVLCERVLELALSARQGIAHVAGEYAVNRYELARALAHSEGLPDSLVLPRLRSEDRWAHIRPMDLSLQSIGIFPENAEERTAVKQGRAKPAVKN